MDANGVAQAVLIQILGQFDNSYQQACVKHYPERFASVVGVDASRADACEMLNALAARGAAGVRLRPDARSPGNDPLAIWRTAMSAGLAVSCVGTSEQFSSPAFFDLVASLPALPIVLEHLGGSSRADTGDEARRRVFAAARYANTYLKVPGLGELVPRPATLPGDGGTVLGAIPAVLREALERFGPDRLMWGSDFPLVASREGYANALAWVCEAIGNESAEAQARILGDTARRVFRLPQH
jgi:L-fuconolactonase